MHLGKVPLSLGGSGVFECLECLVGDVDGFAGVFQGHFRACSDNLAGRGV